MKKIVSLAGLAGFMMFANIAWSGVQTLGPLGSDTFHWTCKSPKDSNTSCSNMAAKLLPSCGFKRFSSSESNLGEEYCSLNAVPNEWECKAKSNRCKISMNPCNLLGLGYQRVLAKAASKFFSSTGIRQYGPKGREFLHTNLHICISDQAVLPTLHPGASQGSSGAAQ